MDHEPLIPLLSTKNLDELPARVNLFRKRMMRFSYSISHVPLTHHPVHLLEKPLDQQEEKLKNDVKTYVD